MKSTLIRWSLCWGLSLAAMVQVAWAQGIPALPNGGMADMSAPPPLPPGGAEPTPAMPMPGGMGGVGGYGGLSDYGMGGAPAAAAGAPGCCGSCGGACDPGAGCCDACAGGGFFGGGGGFSRRVNTFGTIEYLSVWTQGNYFPVLVTTSNPGAPRFRNNNPNLPNAGVLGRGGIPLFGGDEVNTDQKNGGRISFGVFLDPENTVAWVNRFSMIDGGVTRFSAVSDGTTTLARPFFDPVNINPAGENALLLAFTDPVGNTLISRGQVAIEASSDIYVAETFIRSMVHNDGQVQVDLLAGFEYTRVDNDLSIQSLHTFVPNPGPVTFNLHDLITAKNNFYGGVIGFDVEKRWGRFSIETLGKVALGTTHQQVDLHGAGTARVGGARIPLNGAFFVQQTNAGPTLNRTFSRDVWSVVPELNVTLGYWITPHIKATFGYTGIYWTNQVQAGDVIDRRINFTQQNGPLAGPAVPAFNWRDGDFWLQGMHAGLAWDY